MRVKRRNRAREEEKTTTARAWYGYKQDNNCLLCKGVNVNMSPAEMSAGKR